MQLILENDNKLRYQQWPAHVHDAQLTSETKASGHDVCSRPFTLKSPARRSVGGVLCSHNSHTHRTHTVIQQHTGIWSTTLWIGKLRLIFCHQETNFDMLISQKSEQKKSLCNKKARLFQIQRKDDLCWTHDTMLLMREREDNKSSQHWTDTRKAISLAFTDICKLLTQT